MFGRFDNDLPIEIYTDERKAEFLLSNAVDEQDYAWAVREVRKLGIDPDTVPHRRPDQTTLGRSAVTGQ